MRSYLDSVTRSLSSPSRRIVPANAHRAPKRSRSTFRPVRDDMLVRGLSA